MFMMSHAPREMSIKASCCVLRLSSTAMGIPTSAFFDVISQVGNYAESFDRHLRPLGLERGLNALWSDGGLLYPPPAR